MKKTYLKPDVIVVNFVSANMVASSVTEQPTNPGVPDKNKANEQEGSWDNIWK